MPAADAEAMNTTRNPAGGRRRALYLALGCIGVAVALSALLMVTGPSAAPQEPEPRIWPVRTMTVNAGPQQQQLRAFGRITARSSADLAAEVQAVVRKVHVREGDQVAAGTVLVELDTRELDLQLASLTAQVSQEQALVAEAAARQRYLERSSVEQRERLRTADARLERHRQLRERQLISEGLLDTVREQTADTRIEVEGHLQELEAAPLKLKAARAALAIAESERDQLALRRDKLIVTAPYAALITDVSASVGQRLLPGTSLVSVVDRDSLEIRVPVPPEQQHYYRRQQENPSTALPSIVALTDSGHFVFDRLAGAVRPGQSQVDAIFRLKPGSPAPVPGMTTALTINLPPITNAVTLPASALYDGNRVYRVEEGALVAVSVQRLGEQAGGSDEERRIIVRGDFGSNAAVVITRLPRPQPGLRVRVMEPASAGALVQQPAGAGAQPSALRTSSSQAAGHLQPAVAPASDRLAGAARLRHPVLQRAQPGTEAATRATTGASDTAPQQASPKAQSDESRPTGTPERIRAPERYRMS
ncbi:MAG: biotin/lipoyl-binding protein [Pseudomonadota bacterium]